MDLSFDIKNHEGDHILVALSYYDAETIGCFSSDPLTLTLVFYDVTLVRKAGEGYVGFQILNTVSDTLAKFLNDNEDAVLCFYCDTNDDIRHSHKDLLPQEYRSRLFSKMFDLYTRSHNMAGFINHRVEIIPPDNPDFKQYAHFICRTEHQKAVEAIGQLIMEK